MIALLLSMVALAQDLPPMPARPQREPDEPGDCLAKAGLMAGESIGCDSIATPPTYLSHLESLRVYTGKLEIRIIAAEAVRSADARSYRDAIEWRDTQLAQPRPIKPGVVLALAGGGAAFGAGAVLAGAWAVGQVAPSTN